VRLGKIVRAAGDIDSQLFHDDISTHSLQRKHLSPLVVGNLMRRRLAARPAPDLQQPGVEVRILLQRREATENVFLVSRREKSETARSRLIRLL